MNAVLKRHEFVVAGFRFAVMLPGNLDMDRLLPSFIPFAAGCGFSDDCIFVLRAVSECAYGEFEELETFDADMGHVRLCGTCDGYAVELCPVPGAPVHLMCVAKDFSSARAEIVWDDRNAGNVLSSMLRILFSQAVLFHGGISLHASTVVADGLAWLFTGRSGAGKSTHSALWLRNVPGCSLLNDDNPVLRLTGDTVMVYGSPWSGKTPCYRNAGYPAAGAVRIVKAEENRFIPQHDVAAFSLLLPGCSAIRGDRALFDALCDTLAKIPASVPVGILECRADAEAVAVCRDGLGGMRLSRLQTDEE